MLQFSIVVPIYKTEEFLAECVDSVLHQENAPDFELILVDNGSPDNAGAMCDAYAEQDSRVRVIHQENRRPGGGRNAGLHIAQGEYVIFLDSDDWWEPNLLSTACTLLTEKPDVAFWGYYRHELNGEICPKLVTTIMPENDTGLSWLERQFAAETSPEHTPWAYAYKREFLERNHREFRTDLCGPEDFDFNMHTLPKAESIVGTNMPLYNYRVREGSLMTTFSPKVFLDCEQAYAEAFRDLPIYGMADYYAACVLGITKGSPSEMKEAARRIRGNFDILAHTSSRRRLILTLMRVFGVYRGAKLYRGLQSLKRLCK